MNVARVATIIPAIVGACGYVHRRELIHRDITPHNIMFTADEEPRLTYFGIARLRSDASLSADGTLSGTTAYMSPEPGHEAMVANRADIYSLGVVLSEMLPECAL